MKKKIAVLLLLVGCILEAKSFRSSSSGRSSSFRSSSSSSSFKSSSSSSSFKSSSSSFKSSSTSKPVIKSVRPATTTTTTKSKVNTTTTTTNTTKKTTVNNNNTTIINNNNNNTNRGGGLDVMDVILLNSVMNSSRPRETVVVEKPVVITDKDEVKQEVHKTVVVEKQNEGFSRLAMFGIIALVLIMMVVVFL